MPPPIIAQQANSGFTVYYGLAPALGFLRLFGIKGLDEKLVLVDRYIQLRYLWEWWDMLLRLLIFPFR